MGTGEHTSMALDSPAMGPTSLADIVRLNARHQAEREAIVFEGTPITYAELWEGVEQVAAALAAAGIGKGDRVAALARNSPQYVELYFAVAKIGAMLVPLSFWHRSPELAYVLGDAEPVLLLAEPEFLERLESAREEAGCEAPVITMIGPNGEDDEWRAFIDAGKDAPAPEVEILPEDPHMILYTSGTTGRPKGALLSHGRTVPDAFSMAMHLRLRPSDCFINYFPSFHVANWDHLKLYLLVGARVILLREFDDDAVLDAIEQHRPTVMLGVPTMFHRLLDNPRWESTDLSSYRLVYYGAYDPSGLMKEIAKAFGVAEGRAEMFHNYGLTEGGPFVTICPPEDIFDHWGSIGRPMAGVEVALLDDDENEVPQGEAGEICVKGPRMSGYWCKPEETAAALAGGWLHTGDMAVADKDGFMNIVDRKKDMIRTGGQNVYSKEIEDLLSLHDKVDEVAIVGLPDPIYEELVCAVIVVAPGVEASDALVEELTAHVRENLAGYNTPKRVEFVEELPKNAVGKTQKHKLREQLGSMLDAEPGRSTV
jgi:fatty-acyl-CoA synthase